MNHLKIVARIVNLVLAFGMAFATLPAQAAVPTTLNYQGQLTSAAGVPVNATVNITFSLYDVATGGAALWMETKSVAVSNGLYSVMLGTNNPLDSGMFGSPRYLGVSVGADPEMTPRVALSGSATALRAAVADSINCTGCVAASNIAAGSITATELAAGVVAAAQIADGAITAAKLAPGAVTTSWTDGAGKVTTAVNVGVGTTTPAATLHVVGSMNISGNSVQTATDSSNTLLGVGAGNTAMTGTSNTASGYRALYSNTGGFQNTAYGRFALFSNVTGWSNTASGNAALYANTTGGANTASGNSALSGNTTGDGNTASGYRALNANTTGTYNVATGMNALLNNVDGGQNVAVGVSAMNINVSGTGNTAVGNIALLNTTGSNNVALGFNAGGNLTTGSYNIDIGNAGVAAEAATIRIGDANQTRAFISGVHGVTTGIADGLPVVIDSNGQLGTVASLSTIIPASSITGTQLAAGTVAATHIADGAITAAKLAPGAVMTSWADGTGQVTTAANVGVGTVAPVGNARLDVQGGAINIGGNGNADAALHIKSSFGGFDRLTQIHPTAASKPGLNLMASTDSAAAAQWWVWGPDTGNVWRIQPGTGFSGSTGLFIDNTGRVGISTTTPAATLHVVGSMYISGNQVRTADDTSNTLLGVGAGNTNTWGTNNTATGFKALYVNTTGFANIATGSSALYSNTTGSDNTASGASALYSNTVGTSNTATGSSALYSNTTGSDNTASGAIALYYNTAGYANTATGVSALLNNTGSGNIALGFNAGGNLTTGSNNIDIGNAGVAAEANTIRIGDANQTRAFISGIRGVTTGVANAIPVVVDSSGQLGTVSSSRRFKDDIADMSEASNLLMKLRPVTFTYKADKGPERALQYGLIAEEVAAIAPGLVAHSADGQIETVYYQFLAPMLLNEYQKQQRTIEVQAAALTRQTARIAELEQAQKDEIASLKVENARQKERVAELESAKALQEARLIRMESRVQLLLVQALAEKQVANR